MNKNICIVGAGTYGSYLAHGLLQRDPSLNIKMIEVGSNKIKSESEIGYISNITNEQYNAASKGRFFGLGGTSAKWGGQLLFLSENDIFNNSTMDYIRNINIKYKNKVLSKFFKKIPELKETNIESDLYIKTGIWLNFKKRNLFTFFKLYKYKPRLDILTNTRVIQINESNNKITSLSILKDGITLEIQADVFYITCGALESVRLLSSSNIIDLETESNSFSDHISTRTFNITSNNTLFCNHDFSYKFINGSLITTRIIGEIDGVSYYIQPVFNENFIFFNFLKNLIFKNTFIFNDFIKSLKQFYHLFPFVYNYIFKNKLYVYKNWDINIDIETDDINNKLSLSKNVDKYNQNGLDINFNISNSTIEKIYKVKDRIKKLLINQNIDFSETTSKDKSLKLEDTYHPFKLYNKNTSFNERFNPISNLYICNTGLLDRAGGLNPTAVLFCVLEDHLDKNYN
jgi:hypothetical protein